MALTGIEASSNENQLLKQTEMRTPEEITDKIKELQAERKKVLELDHIEAYKIKIITDIDTKILTLQWVLKDELPF